MHIITGDIGGTNSRLALCRLDSSGIGILERTTYASGDYDSLEDIASVFNRSLGQQPDAACFGLPCPVSNGACKITNLPWEVSAGSLSAALGGIHTHILNDLEAMAWGVTGLEPNHLQTLQPGTGDGRGNALVIAAGTGLGQAGMYWDGERHHPFATEGGHCDFAPADELQISLLRHLQKRYRHVSWERLISGPGLENIYEFLIDYRGGAIPDWLETMDENDDLAALISSRARELEDELCIEAIGLFIRLLGAEAGNQALKMKATGGVYIGGGIAPRLMEWLQMPFFLEAFLSKGRMRPLLERMPLHVINTDVAALIGPALCLQAQVQDI
jgi:glucokinase